MLHKSSSFFFLLMIRLPPKATLFSLHDALPISCPSADRTGRRSSASCRRRAERRHTSASWSWDRHPSLRCSRRPRSEEHTSELQSRRDLVCRLLLEKKK